MKGALLRFAVAVMTLVALHAAAASALEDVASGSTLAANEAVHECDTDGIEIAYATEYDASASAYVVTSVAVTDVDSACAGHNATVTVLDLSDNAIASGTAHVTSGIVTIPLSPRPEAAAVSGVSTVIGAGLLRTNPRHGVD